MKKHIKNIIPIIFILISFISCNRYEWVPTSTGGITTVRLVEVKRNGVIFPDTVSDVSINKNDTIDFTVEIELDFNYDDVKLDSIQAYMETDIAIEELPQSKVDSLNTQAGNFSISEQINSEPGNQKIYRTYRFINKVARPNLYGPDLRIYENICLNIKLNAYASPDEGYEKYPDTDIEDFHSEGENVVRLELNNKYRISTFRLYNNYVGKDPEDSTGVGYDINKDDYCHLLSALYCYYDGDFCGDSGACARTLINLTYDTIYNISNEIFIPAFGINHYIRKRISDGFISFSPINIAHNTDGERVNFFNWNRGHKLDRKDGLNQTRVLEVLDIKIGEDYFLNFNSSSSGIIRSYIRVKDIVEDGLDSYVEFDLAINKSQLPQP